MTCPACTEANANPRAGSYRAGCDDCKARMFAGGIAYHDRKTAGVPTQAYEGALRKVFGDRAEWGNQRAKEWAKRIREAG